MPLGGIYFVILHLRIFNLNIESKRVGRKDKKNIIAAFKGDHGRAYVWYLAMALIMLIEWVLMKEGADVKYSNFLGTIFKAAGDVALILLPYWLLNPKWRWAGLLPVWMVAICCVVNLTYYRFWGDLVPPAAVTMGANINAGLLASGFALLHWADIFFFILPTGATALYFLIRPAKSPRFAKRGKLTGIGISMAVGIMGQLSYFKTSYSWRQEISRRDLTTAIADQLTGEYSSQIQFYSYNGLAGYGIRFCADMIRVMTSSVELNKAQREEIKSFLDSYARNMEPGATVADSLNVVYIIVESLNSDMITREIGGKKVMPVLDSLVHSSGTVYFDNVVSQTKASCSSDGHLLLLTGLLPPDKIAYAITYGGCNRFPSLADAMPRHNKYLLLADDGVCWNEGNTLSNFGLGKPLVIKDRPDYDVGELGRDGAMFRQAADMMPRIEQPFLMTLMTISMHIPFKEEAWEMPEEIADAEELSAQERDYANTCNHTDRYIGEFLQTVPVNTLIFIASDHSQDIDSKSGGGKRGAFIALHTGRTERVSRTIGQVNLFPATLDLLGIRGIAVNIRQATGSDELESKSSGGSLIYSGLAPSALNPAVDGTIDSYGKIYGAPTQSLLDSLGRAYRLSDLIIRGDYFNN